MKKIKEIIVRFYQLFTCREYLAYTTIVVNMVFLSLILVFCTLSFETNDDSGMASIAYGAATNRYSMHLIFINSFIGLVLKILLSSIPAIPWYTVLMYLVLFISYSVISYCLLEKDFEWGIFLNFVILIFFGYYTYVSLQFTEVAAVATIAGIMLLFHSIQDAEVRKKKVCLAIVLLLVGAAYRFEMFCVVFIIMSGYGIYEWIGYYCCHKRKTAVRCVILFGVSIVLCFGIEFINRFEYKQNHLYKDYVIFNTYRAELMDHGFPDYEKNQEVYKKYGIAEEDLQLYTSWDFADPDIFNTETLAALVEIKNKDKVKVDAEFLKDFMDWFPKELLSYRWMSAFLLICYLSVVWNHKNIKWVFYELLLLGCLQFYFCYTKRYLQARVDIGIFLAASVVVAGIMLDRVSERMKVRLAVCAIVFVLIPVWYQENTLNKNSLIVKENAERFSDIISKDQENLYLCSVPSAVTYTKAYGIWDKIPLGHRSNIVQLGGWGTNAPFTNYVLNSYQVRNPFRDMVDNPNIYLIDNYHINEIVGYIQRHYNENAYARLVKQVEGASVYQVVTGEVLFGGKLHTSKPDHLKSNMKVRLDYGQLSIKGYAYMKGTSSYQGNAYVLLEDQDGTKIHYQMLQQENEKRFDNTNGKYSQYTFAEMLEVGKCYDIQIFYEHSGSIYCIWEAEDIKVKNKKKLYLKGEG